MPEGRPKLKRDWVGKTVQLVREIENGGGTIFDAGERFKVTGYYRGLELETIVGCQHCNRRARSIIRRVPERDVEIVVAS